MLSRYLFYSSVGRKASLAIAHEKVFGEPRAAGLPRSTDGPAEFQNGQAEVTKNKFRVNQIVSRNDDHSMIHEKRDPTRGHFTASLPE